MPSATIEGINSGLNTAELVNAIIDFERQNAVLLENEQELKTNIISALSSLQAKYIAMDTQLGILQKSSSFEKFFARVSDDSYMDVTTDGRVGTGSYDIQVLAMARNHQLASQGFDSLEANDFGTGSITIQVGNSSEVTIDIDESNNSLEKIKDAINNASAGVTASIINDGSNSNSYRLILSADKTGVANQINFSSDLTGGENLNYTTATFDQPEILAKALSTTSSASLAPSATYSGDENKTYTFTVQGTGAQTVGNGSILIDWTDGTNSGTIAVTQADTEVMLVGSGAEGLSLSFAAGDLTAGDTFQVTSFAPLLQQAADAKIAFGSSGGFGSPITVTSDTNTFDDVISGLTIDLKKVTEPGTSITVSTDIDIDGIKDDIKAFIDRYNDIMSFVDDQNTFDTETKESGILFGDSIVTSMQSSMRFALASVIGGIDSQFNQLASLGIRSDTKGQLQIKDSDMLEEALRDNLNEVIKLFTTSGSSTSNGIEFISATSANKSGQDYTVEITQAATHGYFEGTDIDSPFTTPITIDNTNNSLKLVIDGLISEEIVLTEGAYNSTADLVNELQLKIDADESIGNRGLVVEWIDNGDGTGKISFSSSTYGGASYVDKVNTVENSAYQLLGLTNGSKLVGNDVEGTINGEEAIGKGQFLTGKEDNDTTDGLKIKVTLTELQVADNPLSTLSITKGVASKISELSDSYTKPTDGTFERKINSYKKQIDLIKDRVSEIDERLELRRQTLTNDFIEMEVALGELNGQASYLSSQLSSLNANWKFNQ